MKIVLNEVNIEKRKKKDLDNIKDEIGVIEVIDINSILTKGRKFSNDILYAPSSLETNIRLPLFIEYSL